MMTTLYIILYSLYSCVLYTLKIFDLASGTCSGLSKALWVVDCSDQIWLTSVMELSMKSYLTKYCPVLTSVPSQLTTQAFVSLCPNRTRTLQLQFLWMGKLLFTKQKSSFRAYIQNSWESHLMADATYANLRIMFIALFRIICSHQK